MASLNSFDETTDPREHCYPPIFSGWRPSCVRATGTLAGSPGATPDIRRCRVDQGRGAPPSAHLLRAGETLLRITSARLGMCFLEFVRRFRLFGRRVLIDPFRAGPPLQD